MNVSLHARGQDWLDELIDDVEDGVQAVITIYANWTSGENFALLHPDTSAFEYIKANVASFALDRGDVRPLIQGTNLSFSAIAALTRVHPTTVGRVADEVLQDAILDDEPVERVGIDGKPAKGGRPRKPKPEPGDESTAVVVHEPEATGTDATQVALDIVKRFERLLAPIAGVSLRDAIRTILSNPGAEAWRTDVLGYATPLNEQLQALVDETAELVAEFTEVSK